MKVAALILARGGSKGLPGKNLMPVGGQSLLSRAIYAALDADFVTFVSSDSIEILDEARKHGAISIVRPAIHASDESSSEAAISHAIKQRELDDYEIICFIQPTSPFISSTDLTKSVNMISDGAADTVFASKKDFSFAWRKIDEGWEPEGHSRNSRPRRQELPARVVETGAFYVFTKTGFEGSRSRFSGVVVPLIVDPRFAIDIDSALDLEVALALEPLWRSCKVEMS